MEKGNPYSGLLKAIIAEARQRGAHRAFYSREITDELRQRGYWKYSKAKTPERTVNMYCSQRTDIFDRVGPDQYRLKPEWCA